MKQIEELISDEVTELLLLLILLLLLLMLISLLLSSSLERISFHFVNLYVWRRFLKVCIKFSMFKLSLAIISPIMKVAPPFEQTLIRRTKGLFVCNI